MESRFTINIVTTSVQTGLAATASGFRALISLAQDVAARVSEFGQKGSEAASGYSRALSETGMQLRELGSSAMSVATKIVDSASGITQQIINEAATFEDAQASMRFSFGNDWQNVMGKVLQESAKLTFTFNEVVDLASSLGKMKINPFGTTEANLQIFTSRTGAAVSALEVLQDTADAVGKSTGDLTASIRNAMSGQWKSLEERFDIPKDKIKEWKTAIDKIQDPTKKYVHLIGQLAQMFGGAGQLKEGSLNKSMAQLPDLLQQIKANIGQAALPILAQAILRLVGGLKQLLDSKPAMNALRVTFMALAFVMAAAVDAGTSMVLFVKNILTLAPWLPIVAVGLLAITAALTALVGAGLTAAGIGMAIGAALAILATKAAIVGGLIGIVLVPAALALALVLGGAVAAAAGVAAAAFQVLENDWGGFGATISDTTTIIGAFLEMMSALTRTGEADISLETAEKLKSSGLLGTFQQIAAVVLNVKEAFKSFSAVVGDMGRRLAPVIVPMLLEIWALLTDLGAQLGVTKDSFTALNQPTATWAAYGRVAAEVFIDIVRQAAGLVRVAVAVARLAVSLQILRVIAGLVVALWPVFQVGVGAVTATLIALLAVIVGVTQAVQTMAAALTAAFTGKDVGKAIKDSLGKGSPMAAFTDLMKGPQAGDGRFAENVGPVMSFGNEALARGRGAAHADLVTQGPLREGSFAQEVLALEAKNNREEEALRADRANSGFGYLDNKPAQGPLLEEFLANKRGEGAMGIQVAPDPKNDVGTNRIVAALTSLQTTLASQPVVVSIDGKAIAQAQRANGGRTK